MEPRWDCVSYDRQLSTNIHSAYFQLAPAGSSWLQRRIQGRLAHALESRIQMRANVFSNTACFAYCTSLVFPRVAALGRAGGRRWGGANRRTLTWWEHWEHACGWPRVGPPPPGPTRRVKVFLCRANHYSNLIAADPATPLHAMRLSAAHDLGHVIPSHSACTVRAALHQSV